MKKHYNESHNTTQDDDGMLDKAYARGFKDGHKAVVKQFETAFSAVIKLLGQVDKEKLEQYLESYYRP